MVAQFAKEQEQRKLALLEQMKKIEEEGEAQAQKVSLSNGGVCHQGDFHRQPAPSSQGATLKGGSNH